MRPPNLRRQVFRRKPAREKDSPAAHGLGSGQRLTPVELDLVSGAAARELSEKLGKVHCVVLVQEDGEPFVVARHPLPKSTKTALPVNQKRPSAPDLLRELASANAFVEIADIQTAE